MRQLDNMAGGGSSPGNESAPVRHGPERLLRNQRFVRFTLAKFLQLLTQYALIYGLFIAVISRQESSLTTSAFVLASIVPSVLLSVPGGLVADLLPKKLVLTLSMAARIVIVFFFLDSDLGLNLVLTLTLLTWTAYQFFTPAESAALPAIAAPNQINAATSLLHAISLVAQLTGAGAVAPLAVRLLGLDGLFSIVLLLMVSSALLYLTTSNLSPGQDKTGPPRPIWWRSMPQGLRAIRSDETLIRLTALRVLVDAGTLMVVVAAPAFIQETLNSGTENAIYLASPVALGIAIGLLATPPLLSMFSARTMGIAGFSLFIAIVLTLPLIDPVSQFITDQAGFLDWLRRTSGLSRQVLTTVFLLPWAGLGISFVQVSSRTVVYRRVHPRLTAQVFATQSAVSSIATLLPPFIAEALLDLLPVEVVLVGFGAGLAGLAVAAFQSATRPGESSTIELGKEN